MSKTAQHSQLKTKFYGIVKGLFTSFKGIVKNNKPDNKEEYIIELAKKIGSFLVAKLKKNVRKNLLIQLDKFEKEITNKDQPEVIIGNIPHSEEEFHPIGPYTQLRSLAKEEKRNSNYLSQKFFDLLVIYEIIEGSINCTSNNMSREEYSYP